ncbi:18608_t:CDS:2 [Gigaspora margarita]|uniref:18608_t:CDS:1 n=1 Tax=Gigaspora margarita TaxID=4874 RepID=A0ABN7UP76_GIGMA|nr:18608_t:CDS:2 [Gigaspora margarita]
MDQDKDFELNLYKELEKHEELELDIYEESDIFDRQLYKSLLFKELIKDEHDIILSGSLDGYQIFHQQQDGNWIIMFINNNILPEDHIKQENLLIAAIILGPKSPKDFNSFIYPIPPLDITKYSNSFKAEDWINWTCLYSIPILQSFHDKR